MIVRSVSIATIGVFLLAFSARGAALTVEGTVKDHAGRPIKGADVSIQTKGFSKVVKTDANGHYKCDVVASGNNKVTVLVNRTQRTAMVNADSSSTRTTKLAKPSTPITSTNKHKRMVWVAPEIGTHIGGGSFVEVDDKSEAASQVTANNVKKMGRNALTSDVSIRNGVSCPGLGGGYSGAGLAVGRTVSTFIGSSDAH